MDSHRSYSRIVGLSVLALCLSCFAAFPAATAKKADPARYIEHVRFLASPEQEGRGAGSEGLDRAAEYITEQFKALGGRLHPPELFLGSHREWPGGLCRLRRVRGRA
jgi:hypothetical protein